MTALIIILSIIVFFALLLFLPISLFLSYEQKFFLRVRFSGITVYKLKDKPEEEPPAEEQEVEKVSKEDETPKKQNFFVNDYKKRGFSDFVSYYAAVLKELIQKVLWLLRKMHFKLFCFSLSVASDDAAQTAVRYGAVCSALYPLFSIIMANTDVKVKRIEINADFVNQSSSVAAKLNVRTNLFVLLIFAVYLLKKYRSVKKDSENYERKQ